MPPRVLRSEEQEEGGCPVGCLHDGLLTCLLLRTYDFLTTCMTRLAT